MASAGEYDEQLRVPGWYWLVAAALVALLGAEFHIGLALPWKIATYAVMGGLVAALLLRSGATRVRIAEGSLIASGSTLPLGYAGRVDALDATATRAVMGPAADPDAYLVTRPWVHTAVRVQVVDPHDDTPYWLLGTRHPEALAAALERARARR